MNTPSPIPNALQLARTLLKDFQEKYVAFRDCLPLTIGIDKQLAALYPEVSRKTLRLVLGLHTNSLRYLKGMEKATNRFDLEGNPAEEITQLHRDHAKQVLKERARKVQQQKNAQRQAQRAAEAEKAKEQAAKAAQEAAAQHAEKLNLLAEKFARRN